GVAPRVESQFCDGQIPGAGGQSLDLRAGDGLASQEDRGHGDGQGGHFRVQADDGGSDVVDRLQSVGGDGGGRVELGDVRGDRCAVGSAAAAAFEDVQGGCDAVFEVPVDLFVLDGRPAAAAAGLQSDSAPGALVLSPAAPVRPTSTLSRLLVQGFNLLPSC